MTVITEGNLEITINNELNVRKFDAPTRHGLRGCLKRGKAGQPA